MSPLYADPTVPAALVRGAFRPIANADETLYRGNAEFGVTALSGQACFSFFQAQTNGARTTIKIGFDTAASGLTSAFVALYSFDGTTLTRMGAGSGDIHTAVNAVSSGSVATVTIPSATIAQGSDYAVGALYIGTTPPVMRGSFTDFNRQLDAPPVSGAVGGQTSLTGTVSLASLGNNFAFRAVISA